MRPRLVLLAPLALTLAACAPTPGADDRAPATAAAERPTEAGPLDLARCGAADLSDAPGKYLVAGTAGPNEVNEDDLPFPHRILGPGDPMTKDLRPERLTIFVTETGRIQRLHCG
ncbi:I78 family peptidase inhibitor [Caenispirillum salinarum]|uniref:I78 family peptidase inhibitor n=1 Tax=Caenispirillum salinarum TaxID=859058 RepID=UPI00385039A0